MVIQGKYSKISLIGLLVCFIFTACSNNPGADDADASETTDAGRPGDTGDERDIRAQEDLGGEKDLGASQDQGGLVPDGGNKPGGLRVEYFILRRKPTDCEAFGTCRELIFRPAALSGFSKSQTAGVPMRYEITDEERTQGLELITDMDVLAAMDEGWTCPEIMDPASVTERYEFEAQISEDGDVEVLRHDVTGCELDPAPDNAEPIIDFLLTLDAKYMN